MVRSQHQNAGHSHTVLIANKCSEDVTKSSTRERAD